MALIRYHPETNNDYAATDGTTTTTAVSSGVVKDTLTGLEIPALEWHAIRVNHLLGLGSFAAVYEVEVDSELLLVTEQTTVSCSDDGEPSSIHHQQHHGGSRPPRLGRAESFGSDTSSCSSSSTCSSGTSGSSSASALTAHNKKNNNSNNESPSTLKAALKGLKERVRKSSELRPLAAADLTKEARLLAQLRGHPHIVQLYGLSPYFFVKPERTRNCYRYMALERLDETLDRRLQQWKKQPAPAQPLSPNHNDDECYARLRRADAVGIAHALAYLHQHHIMFRDVKPANIGYTVEGRAKLFDFGLARTVPTTDQERRQLTGCTGTLRYMAPEVALERADYHTPVDVYSFGMLLWELCTYEPPYATARTLDQLHEWVVTQTHGPVVKERVASEELRALLTACWRLTPGDRPTMAHLAQDLEWLASQSNHDDASNL